MPWASGNDTKTIPTLDSSSSPQHNRLDPSLATTAHSSETGNVPHLGETVDHQSTPAESNRQLLSVVSVCEQNYQQQQKTLVAMCYGLQGEANRHFCDPREDPVYKKAKNKQQLFPSAEDYKHKVLRRNRVEECGVRHRGATAELRYLDEGASQLMEEDGCRFLKGQRD